MSFHIFSVFAITFHDAYSVCYILMFSKVFICILYYSTHCQNPFSGAERGRQLGCASRVRHIFERKPESVGEGSLGRPAGGAAGAVATRARGRPGADGLPRMGAAPGAGSWGDATRRLRRPLI